jgi:hypothetical protein
MKILLGVIDGFKLHPLNETSTLPVLTLNCVEEGFLSSAILAFKYCHVKNKLPLRGNSQQTKSSNPPAPSPYRHNNNEVFTPPFMLYAVIRVCSKDNIKVACKEIGWDISETGLQIWYKEHQSADLNAQILLMCVPNIFDWEGVEGEILWHFTEIEKSLLKKGALPAEFVGKPLPKIRVSWHQNKQGKGRSKVEKSMSLNSLPGFCQNGCLICSVKAAERDWKRLSIPWEKFNKMGLCRQVLGRKSLMVVNYNGRPTNSDQSILQRLHRCTVVYAYNLSFAT